LNDFGRKPVVQVRPELTNPNGRIQVGVCRCQHADADLPFTGTTDRPHSPVLQQSEQHGLNVPVEFADFI
jgi:hypothetical protein